MHQVLQLFFWFSYLFFLMKYYGSIVIFPTFSVYFVSLVLSASPFSSKLVKLGTMKGDINTYRMVKVPCRLMHWVTLFGPFLGPNLPKNRHFVNFLENGSYDFF